MLSPYLMFSGDCAEAFRSYERIFGGRIVAMFTHRHAPAGMPLPPDWEDKVMHACLEVNGRQLMGSDRPGNGSQPVSGISVQLELPTPDDADRVFAALAEGGTIIMPIAETFWARRFGVVTDRFGIPFMVNCSKPALDQSIGEQARV